MPSLKTSMHPAICDRDKYRHLSCSSDFDRVDMKSCASPPLGKMTDFHVLPPGSLRNSEKLTYAPPFLPQSDQTLPDYKHLINFPYISKRGNTNSKYREEACCVMCGELANAPGTSVCRIPTQNKGVCRSCDSSIWYHVSTKSVFKWCKGCKRFYSLEKFGKKVNGVKCSDCRERGRQSYLAKKRNPKKNERLASLQDYKPCVNSIRSSPQAFTILPDRGLTKSSDSSDCSSNNSIHMNPRFHYRSCQIERVEGPRYTDDMNRGHYTFHSQRFSLPPISSPVENEVDFERYKTNDSPMVPKRFFLSRYEQQKSDLIDQQSASQDRDCAYRLLALSRVGLAS